MADSRLIKATLNQVQRAWRLAQAGRQHLSYMARTGTSGRVPEPVFQRRLLICQTCEYYNVLNPQTPCLICGCRRLKLKLASQQCPIAKW